MDKDLKSFIRHCLNDESFWIMGGILSKENQYIKELGLTEEQKNTFYEAMCKLQKLSKEMK